ncbi:MAG: helix-turn-helix domain-containing protein, partial [Eubacteriales bacterium]|nr:helix-turn-helix domain-containing protein [Eubacteriales bacterium]
DHAAQLLQSSQLNVSEVACSVGYDDPYYFSRVFRQRFHCSPRDYLQKMREPS